MLSWEAAASVTHKPRSISEILLQPTFFTTQLLSLIKTCCKYFVRTNRSLGLIINILVGISPNQNCVNFTRMRFLLNLIFLYSGIIRAVQIFAVNCKLIFAMSSDQKLNWREKDLSVSKYQ